MADGESRATSLSPRDQRSMLPRGPGDTPPIAPVFGETVRRSLGSTDIEVDGPAMAAIEAHARLLLAWNGAINLTAHRTPERLALLSVADSLTALPLIGAGCDLLDLGSGAGYPGLPLAVARPAGRVALLDSIGKKAGFLEVAAEAAMSAMRTAGAEPPRIASIRARAEDLAADPAHRGAWDVVAVRAVAALTRLSGLAMPLLRTGGLLIAWKRDDGRGSLERELEDARPVIQRLGGRAPTVHRVTARGLRDHRLVVVRRRPLP